MKLKLLFMFLPSLVLLNACKIYNDIQVNCDQVSDFSKYKTYAWLPDKMDSINSPYNNEVIRNNLRNYFGKQFSERGYKFDSKNPDFLLRVVLVNHPKTLTVVYPPLPLAFYQSRYYYKSEYYSPYPFDYYYNRYQVFCNPLGYCTETIPFIEGSITLQMIDKESNTIIWSCSAKGDIYDPSYVKRSIHPAVKEIMKRFPVRPVQKTSQNGNKIS